MDHVAVMKKPAQVFPEPRTSYSFTRFHHGRDRMCGNLDVPLGYISWVPVTSDDASILVGF